VKYGQRASIEPKAEIPLCDAENGWTTAPARPSKSGAFRSISEELRHPAGPGAPGFHDKASALTWMV